MNRIQMLDRLNTRSEPWDLVVIGGGATGVGIAVDAASRGYAVTLLERDDFGKGTSSRSTKLVHGGVRYLAQGNISLVREALHERERLLANAPHLVHVQSFIVPAYRWLDLPFYWVGLKAYDLLAGRNPFGRSHRLSRGEVIRRLPTIRTDGLVGGIVYQDGQFDDTRLLIDLAKTAAEQGGVLLNHAPVVGLTRDAAGRIDGVTSILEPGHDPLTIRARAVINATGAFVDGVRRLADATVRPLVAPSQGTHIVLDRAFLPTDQALIVPKTSDGRVMFAIPWHGHTVIGTTDVPVDHAEAEPRATEDEIAFLLATSADYLATPPTRADVRAVFTGIRPLVKATETDKTSKLSRDHTIVHEADGLTTITGGKWTTYRHMAEDCVNQVAERAGLGTRPCVTYRLPIHGSVQRGATSDPLAHYGTDAAAIRELQRSSVRFADRLDVDLPYTAAEVVWAAREEMASTVEDVLARRTRALFLNADAAIRSAPRTAALLAEELGHAQAWQTEQVAAFTRLADGYQIG